MIASRYAARLAIVALVCALATLWLGWLSLPVIGFLYAIVDRNTRARGTVAAVGAAAGWLAILCSEVARGADMREVASKVGAVMQVPSFALFVVTLAFAALLCGSAAVIGSMVVRGKAH